MTAGVSPAPGAMRVGALCGIALVVLLVSLSGVVTVLIHRGFCDGASDSPVASAHAVHDIPPKYLPDYQAAGREYGVRWPILAAIGSIESDHGRSHEPGVRSSVNRHGCCAGPMQFNITDGPPSTWDRYAVDGNHDGHKDVYDPQDAIPSAANYLRALLRDAHGDVRQAIFGYNHSESYVDAVLAQARAYATDAGSSLTAMAGTCANEEADAPVGPGNLREARRVTSPRSFRMLPDWAMAPGRGREPVDARIYPDVIWILRRYHLRVTAAREAGHHTHGDGTAVDLIPADGTRQRTWDNSAGRLAHDLGWTASCAHSGSRPACPLVRAIQFVGYDGYPGHGSPRTCRAGCPAHIHVSWVSPCFGSSGLSPPCVWVMAFPAAPSDEASAAPANAPWTT